MIRISRAEGFTLIELSIVLVIIGLIVGGILVGQNLISAAGVRAQVSQIEKYNQAVNTFYGKYQALPGDMAAVTANQFGFAARGQYAGQGDGNGVIEGVWGNSGGANQGWNILAGETAMFWVDLSTAGIIDGNFTTANAISLPGSTVTFTSTPNIDAYLPKAKIGFGNYIYVYSGGSPYGGSYQSSNINYFGLSAPSSITISCCGRLNSSGTIPVLSAYRMDAKIDDGLPQSGRVTTQYLNGDPYWTDGTDSLYNSSSTSATQPSTTTCMDNNNIGGLAKTYSLSSQASYGAGGNCALSFKMQGAGR